MGIALEATRGTAVAPNIWIPVKGPQWTPNITMLSDMGLRGSMVDEYDQIAGLRHDTLDFTCDVYGDTFGNLVRATLGSPDTVVGTVAPYTHTLGLLNTTDGQPPSYTLSYFDGNEIVTMPSGQCDSLNVKFNAAALLEATVKFFANPATVGGTVPASAFSTLEAIPSWSVATTIGGTVVTKTIDGELDLKRNVKPIEALTGTQSPYRLWAGPLSTSGKLTLVYESDVELNYFLSNTKGEALDVKFTDPAGTDTVEIHLSTPAWKTGKINPGKEYVEVDLEFVGLPNATDAVTGGVAPVKIAVSNAIATAY